VRKGFLFALLTIAVSAAIVGCEPKYTGTLPDAKAPVVSAGTGKGAGQNAEAAGFEPGPGNAGAEERVGSGLKGK
jgi:hypothetical protein